MRRNEERERVTDGKKKARKRYSILALFLEFLG